MFGERVPVEQCSFSVNDSDLGQAANSRRSGISWSFIPLLTGFLELATLVGLSRPRLPCPDGCEGIGGEPVATGASSLSLPPFLSQGSGGALAGGFDLLILREFWATSLRFEPPLELALSEGLRCVGPSWSLAKFVLQALAWCPNLRHFLHWFGRLE